MSLEIHLRDDCSVSCLTVALQGFFFYCQYKTRWSTIEYLRYYLTCSSPTNTDKSYNELEKKLKEHFNLKPVNVSAYRHAFPCRNQAVNEPLAEYMAELCRLAAPGK